MRPAWLARFLAFDRRRRIAFVSILTAILGLGLGGVWIGVMLSFVGTPLFILGLLVWFVPGVLFDWTGFFQYHEFGAAPNGVAGYVVMLLFYAAISAIASWPFAPKRE